MLASFIILFRNKLMNLSVQQLKKQSVDILPVLLSNTCKCFRENIEIFITLNNDIEFIHTLSKINNIKVNI